MYYQISLLAAYIAGMVALFAPCCVTYLLPAYLGNVFRERTKVLLMTLVYSLGIFVVMLPVVLGAKMLTDLFFRIHDQTYLIGGVFLLLVAAFSFLGIKLPMPRFAIKGSGERPDVISTFTLGVFSGITSACCAPVLVGVIALSSLTPSTLMATGVGAAYVLGMVTPLYLTAWFINARKMMLAPVLKKRLTTIYLFGQVYPIFVANIVSTVIFTLIGLLTIYLTVSGQISATDGMDFAKSLNWFAWQVTDFVNKIPFLNWLGVGVGVYLLYRFIKEAVKS